MRDTGQQYGSAEKGADTPRRSRPDQGLRTEPAPFWERISHGVRRNPGRAALVVSPLLMVVLGFSLLSWQWRSAEQRTAAALEARDRAEESEAREKEARRQAQRLVVRNALSQGMSLCDRCATERGLLWLARALELAEAAGDDDLARAARLNLAAWQPYLVHLQAELPHNGGASRVAFAPDGSLATTGRQAKSVRLWDRDGKPLGQPLSHRHPVSQVVFSPDGKTLLTGSGGGEGGEGCLWDVATGRLLASWPHSSQVLAIAFHPTGRTCLTLSVEQTVLHSVPDGKPVGKTIEHPRPARTVPGIATPLTGGFSPNGKLIVTAGEDGVVHFWDAATGEPQGKTLRAGSPIQAAVFSPDSRTLLIGCADGNARLWDVAAGLPRSPLLPHRGPVHALAFSPDGNLAATASTVQEINFQNRTSAVVGGEVHLWRVPTGEAIGSPWPHPKPVESLAFSPKGRRLLTGCEDGIARMFLIAGGELMAQFQAASGKVAQVAFRDDGTLCAIALAGGSTMNGVRLWRIAPENSLPRLLLHHDTVRALSFSPDGRTLASGGDDRVALLWDIEAGLIKGQPLSHPYPVSDAVFSPSGQTLYTACETSEQTSGLPRVRWSTTLWDLTAGQKRLDLHPPRRPRCAAFCDRGRTLVLGDGEGVVQAYEVSTSKPVGPRIEGRGAIHSLAFDAGAKSLLLGQDGRAALFDWDARRERKRLSLGETAVRAYFSPDERSLLLVQNGFARIWDRDGDECQGPPLYHSEGGIQRLAFAPDGRGILIGDGDGRARLWDVSTGMRIGPAPGPSDTPLVAYCPNGHYLAVAGKFGRIALWPTPKPMQGSAERLRLWTETLAGLELDFQLIAHPLDAAQLRLHRARLDQLGGPPPSTLPGS